MAEGLSVVNGWNLGQANPPWLLWGNTQQITVAPSAGASTNEGNTNTLLRVSYNRPETWRFLFAARILSAPQTNGTQHAELTVWFELLTGIGRSAIQLPFFSNIPDFTWDLGAAVPDQVRWTNLAFNQLPGFTTSIVPTETITGQDMTIVAHVRFATDIPAAASAVVEVSGQFAPNVHVRPDWSRIDADPAEQFPGGETGGR